MSERLDFWARRKAAVQAEEEAEARAQLEKGVAEERAALEEKSDEEILAELNLPDPDSLKMGDDIRGFIGQAVPDRLRRRALRQLWKLNPVLANVDGLVDYGEDFTDAALVVENMQTTYQVGKGMLAHVKEMARQAEEKEARTRGEIVDEPTVEDDADEDLTPEPPEKTDDTPEAVALAEAPHDPVGEDTPTAKPETQQNQSDTHFAAASKRRMRFAFED